MTALAIELGSFSCEAYLPIITQTLQNVDSQLYIVIFLSPSFLPKLDTPAKRAGVCKPLQDLISALYVCTASRTEISCDIIFSDWCGYSLENEIWEYSVLSIPEGMGLRNARVIIVASPEIVKRLPKSTMSFQTVTYRNGPEKASSDTDASSIGKDHPVVAGRSQSSKFNRSWRDIRSSPYGS